MTSGLQVSRLLFIARPTLLAPYRIGDKIAKACIGRLSCPEACVDLTGISLSFQAAAEGSLIGLCRQR